MAEHLQDYHASLASSPGKGRTERRGDLVEAHGRAFMRQAWKFLTTDGVVLDCVPCYSCPPSKASAGA
eukprot:10681033-Alexandrium_andersonii.AAC.1